MSAAPSPFRLKVPEPALQDLRERLARTRFPDEPPLEPWATGTSLSYLKDLVGYWQAGFDWRAQEARLNRFAQYKVAVGGIELHFIHEPGRGARPMPLLLMHGWPGSVWEFHRLIPLLTEHFTVVAPSLPGFTLSYTPGPAALRQRRDGRSLRRADERSRLPQVRRARRRLGRVDSHAARLRASASA